MALLDLWHPEQGMRRILPGYGRGEEPLPVYKMPHSRAGRWPDDGPSCRPSAATRCW